MKRWLIGAVMASVVLLGGCAHSGAIGKSPCACEFHALDHA